MTAMRNEKLAKPVFTTRNIDVATYDIDFAGVVSNIVYVRWMEDMRLAMTRAPHFLPLVSLVDGGAGIAPAVTKTEIHYRRPIKLGDQVIGSAWCSSLTSRKVTVDYEFHVDDKRAAYGQQSGCFIDIASKKFARTPQSWIDIYAGTT